MADTSSQSTTDIVLGATVSGRCVASVRGPAANNNQLRSPAVDLLEQHDAALRKAHARLCSHDLSARVTPALSGSLAASWPAQSVLMRLWPSSSCPFQFVRLLQRIWNITSTTCLPLLPQTANVSLRLAFTTNLVSSWPSYLRKAGAFCILPDLAADTGSGGTRYTSSLLLLLFSPSTASVTHGAGACWAARSPILSLWSCCFCRSSCKQATPMCSCTSWSCF